MFHSYVLEPNVNAKCTQPVTSVFPEKVTDSTCNDKIPNAVMKQVDPPLHRGVIFKSVI
jgi:hypothetical protein